MSQISDGYPVKLTDRRREGGRGGGGGGGRGGGGERQKKEGFSAEGTFTVGIVSVAVEGKVSHSTLSMNRGYNTN